MITSSAWRGKRYAVLGLARSGTATMNALVAGGAHVTAWDGNVERLRDIRRQLGHMASPPPHVAGEMTVFADTQGSICLEDPIETDLAGYTGVVVSPGVPINRHPIAAKARAADVPIIGDIELFAQARAELPPHKVVGITGTNGKSTTTALIHHILQTAGVPSLMGGNIGLPILAQEPLPEGGVYVLELSSYQIDLTQSLDCDVAVLLNVTPDHLDRYEGFRAYRDSKLRLFRMQSHEHDGVVASDDPELSEATLALIQGPGLFSNRVAGVPLDWPEQSDWPALQGPHNAENVFAARAVTLALGIHSDIQDEALRTFTGLPHRMQRVGERDGVAYVDDSKATNPESVAPALAAFDRVHWILGGQAKSDDLDACRPYFGRVAHAYTIGEAGPRFAQLLRPVMAVDESGTLDLAVKAAATNAKAGETVLLSPACASFDQFRDYEARGDAFRAAVEALA